MSVAVKSEEAERGGRIARAGAFWASAIGKKALMALTGIILFAYVIAHLLGNLQLYMGREKINAYARFLHSTPGVLWSARIVLLAAVIVHVFAGVQLYLEKRRARPIGYRTRVQIQASAASRTMIWSGILIFAFVIYHLLHFTTGTVHPDFRELDVYDNVVTGFRVVPASIAYVVAMVGLGFHLWHGVYAMFQSLGLSHPGFTPGVRRFAALAATLIALGNISMPIAVLTGLVGS